jgi:hypothetical protein
MCPYVHFKLLMNKKMVFTSKPYSCLVPGTMSGGGKTVCKGRMGSAVISDVDPKELSNMENSLEKVRYKLILSLAATRNLVMLNRF